MNLNTAVPVALVALLAASGCTAPAEAPKNAATSPAAGAPAPAEDVAAVVSGLEREWVAAIEKKDTATLDRLLAPDFVGTSPTAHSYTKSQAIDDLKASNYVVDKMTLDEVAVNVYGTTAVAFASQEEQSKYAGKDTSGHYHYTDVWVKRDGKWQAVASHGTRYDKPAATEKAK